jgi:hypothetical protein
MTMLTLTGKDAMNIGIVPIDFYENEMNTKYSSFEEKLIIKIWVWNQ